MSSSIDDLDETQQSAVDLALEGKNFFLSGSAGTGKSYVLKHIIQALKHKNVALTSSTGISAQHIGGTTIHSFAGIGLGELDADELVLRVRSSRKAMARWRRCDVLIIDEISMIAKNMFTKLEYIAREIRGSEEPFGGVQLIAVGDMFQLAPVEPGNPKGVYYYAFESPVWWKCLPHSVLLTRVHRQRADEPNHAQFLAGLSALRLGVLTPEFKRLLQACKTQPKGATGIIPTCLYAHNVDVDAMNRDELRKLPGLAHEFQARTKIVNVEYLSAKPQVLDAMFPIPQAITLKENAQVMFLKNTDLYCNGTRGVVTGFLYEDEEEEEEDEPSSKKRRPAPIGVKVRLVNGSEIEVRPETFEHTVDKKVAVSRTGLPLKLAWAITHHKSQSLSLDAVEIHLEKVTRPSPGQVYVAISRATTLTNLKVYGLETCRVYADPKVLAFYNEMAKKTA